MYYAQSECVRRNPHQNLQALGIRKVNTNARCLGQGGRWLGMVVRDWTGSFRFCVVKREAERWSPTNAEGRAILFAIKKLKEMQWRTVRD
ncbi:unnamed protein product [Linum trigynum]|uniref:RNase H type-1 domain-containing protein n=1 Tax=Linum trigynum TaxID=586398 RepID=A0AAV2E531_9ROSI